VARDFDVWGDSFEYDGQNYSNFELDLSDVEDGPVIQLSRAGAARLRDALSEFLTRTKPKPWWWVF
jgi:hypothetical protein